MALEVSAGAVAFVLYRITIIRQMLRNGIKLNLDGMRRFKDYD